jgi:hypothetical protein
MATDPTEAPSPAPIDAIPRRPVLAPSPPQRKPSYFEYLLLGRSKPGELIVFRHSGLFYWWPVWGLGFILAGVTWLRDYRMAVVPAGAMALENRRVDISDGQPPEIRDVIVLADKTKLVQRKNAQGELEIFQPSIFMWPGRTPGTLFVIVLLIVIGITNVPLRGLWSVLVVLLVIMLSIIFAVAGWWETIFARLGQLSIHINLGGYLLIATVLFVIWLINFFVLDRQIYMVFTPGQVRMRLEIGGEETVYDTTGMVVQKQRGDMFRHWILGFGSGDLIVRPVGVMNPIELPNVLRVTRVVRAIETMVKEKVVITMPGEKGL